MRIQKCKSLPGTWFKAIAVCSLGYLGLSLVLNFLSVQEPSELAGRLATKPTPATANATAAKPEEKEQIPLFAFLAFGKVGSTSMRDWMTEHSIDGKTPPCDPWHQERDGKPPCESLPAGSFVNVGAMPGFKFCDDARAEGRPCKYFTLLRDPIDRVVSAYKYFCVKCSENKRQCKGGYEAAFRKELKCPDMSLVEYARVFGNPYTRAFVTNGNVGIPFDFPLGDEPLERVMEFIRREHVVVFGLEQMQTGNQTLDLLGHPATAGISQEQLPVSNANKQQKDPILDNSTLAELQKILYYDIQLYQMLGLATGRTTYSSP